MAANTIGLNQTFPIYNENGTPFHNLVLRKGVVDSVVMSLGDKITGDVYYSDNTLAVTMKEYIEFNGIKYSLVNPPTVVREGVVSDNSELKGMTKYSFEFYHPMYMLANFPFTDVATTVGEEKYLSQNKVFSWIGKPQDFIDKLNKNLQGTVWCVRKSDRFPSDKNNELSDVLTFDNATVAEAIKIGYETWDIPYVVTQIPQTDPLYAQGKRFVVEYGLPSNEIYENDSQRQLDNPFVFRMGKGVGLKNNSRTPRNNKIITRIAGYGSEDNVPYGYPQIVWTGNQDWDYTINNDPNEPLSYPIYKGIVGGQYVKLIKHPFTRTHLMPSIYTDTVNKKVNPYATGYDPTIEIKDYYDAVASQQYPYVNEINLQAPSYDSHEFPDIKPEFDSESSIGIISAIPLNSDLTPADHWDDSMDDDGNYLQSYFQITLPQLDFDLYACAAITQEMKINMRSGACIGCTFPIQVDWDDYKANFYDSDGNFLPDGEQRDLTKYPKSNLGQISVVVQKDNTTFGTLMPNIYQQPVANDLFVFIGISLPLSYITDAEERLDDAMKTYMLENNVFYFDYPLKFDEHFLATHTYILEQIRPNSIIRFEYGGVQQQLFVKQLTVKYGNAALPQYDITLTDNIEVVLNQIGQVADDVEKLSSLLSLLRQSYSRNVWNELAKKLSKTQDDTASGYIRMLKGLQVGANFVPDILGEGGVLRMRSDGKVELVTDILYARMKAYFDTVEIREYQHTAGNRIASVAGNKCVRVAWFNSSNVELEQTQANLSSVAYFRCFFRASDGEDTVRNNFKVGDQAYCHITSVDGSSDNPEQKGFNQKHYWRLVVGRNVEGTLTDDNEGWIDLSNRSEVTIGGINYQGYQSGSDVPQAQDDIIQLGNVNDTTRQGAIVEYVTGTDAPSYQIYQGINSFSLNGKNYVRLGYDSQSGGAQAYIGNPNGSSYLWYHLVNGTPKLEIKAKVEITSTESTIDGTPISQYDFYDDTQIWSRIADMQEQIDGAIETYYMVGEPALNLPPVVSTQAHPYDDPWLDGTETPAERTTILNNHVGDLYYDKNTGHGYRFLYDDDSHDFAWVVLTDEDVTEALRIANEAQDTADGKRTIYSVWNAWVKDNVNTLKNGDLFIPTSDTTQGGNTYYARKVYKCTTDGTSTFSEINYTDDSALNSFLVNTYASDKTNLQNQIDGKAETWRQESDPASSWTDADTKAKHVGDLWMDTSANGGKKTYIYTDNGSSANPRYTWEAQDIPDEVFDDIDGKSSIYVNDPTAAQNPTPTNYKERDLWILGGAATINGVAYKSGDVLTSLNDNQTYSASDWIKKVRYTDDSSFDGYITQILNGTGSTSANAAVVAAAQKAIKDALGGGTVVDGGLLLTSLIAMRKYNETTQSYTTWAGISGQYQDSETGLGYKGHGIAAWYGGNNIDYELLTSFDISEGWNTVRWARSLFRFDGSGYVANGNITWEANGALTIKNITTLSDTNNTNLLNELATFNSAFTFGTSGQGSTTALHITPNVPFTSLYIGMSSADMQAVATQSWVNNNYVTKAFFEAIFMPQDSNGNRITTNGSTSALDRLKILVGAYTDQYLSALGYNSSGGGAGGTGDVTWTLLADNSDTRQIALSHLTGALSGYIHPTLSSLAEGNILVYDGSKWVNTPWPLTGYATQSWVNTQLSGYLPLSGGTISGALTVTSSALFKNSISFRDISRATGSDYYAGMLLDNRGLYIGFDEGVNNQLNVDGAGRFNSLYIGSAAVATQSWVTSLGYLAPTLSGLANGDILVYDSVGTWVNTPLSSFGFATRTWVGQQGYITGITSSMITTALGYTPANGSNYLPLTGGTLTGDLTLGGYTSSNSRSIKIYSTASEYVDIHADVDGLQINCTHAESSQFNVSASESYFSGDVLGANFRGLFVRDSSSDSYVLLGGGGHALISGLSVSYAGSAGSVAWTNVSGRPTNVSSFTNDSGYITSAALNGYIHPTLSGLANGDILVYDSVGAWVNVTKSSFLSGYALTSQIPTNNNQLTNGAGYITSSALNGYVHPTLSSLAEGNILVYDGSKWVNTPWPLTGYATQSWVNTQLAGYLPLSGGTMTGSLTINGTTTVADIVSAKYKIVSDTRGVNFGFIISNIAETKKGVFSYYQDHLYISNYVGTTETSTIAFYENGDAAIHGRNFGIGTASPTNKLTIVGDAGDGVETVRINATRTTTWNYSLGSLMNLTNTTRNLIAVGAGYSAYNCGLIGFYYAGNGSVNNFLSLGLYAQNDVLVVRGSGYIGIGTTSPSYKLDVNGSANATTLYENGSRVITTANIGSQSVNYATSAGSVSWSNVSGRPTNVSSFTNDSGYITAIVSNHFEVRSSSNPYILFHMPNVNWARIEFDGSFHFKNGESGGTYHSLTAYGFVKDGSSSSYVLTGDGGHKLASDFYKILGKNVYENSGHSLSNGDMLVYDSGTGWINIPSGMSDIRKKDVINYNAEPTFEAVANAPAIRFTYKDARYSFNQGVKVGSIAQYWKTELPEAVNEDNEGYLSMQYEVIGLLAAIAVAKRVTNHERRIESLERENALLRLELNKLKEVA